MFFCSPLLGTRLFDEKSSTQSFAATVERVSEIYAKENTGRIMSNIYITPEENI